MGANKLSFRFYFLHFNRFIFNFLIVWNTTHKRAFYCGKGQKDSLYVTKKLNFNDSQGRTKMIHSFIGLTVCFKIGE